MQYGVISYRLESSIEIIHKNSGVETKSERQILVMNILPLIIESITRKASLWGLV